MHLRRTRTIFTAIFIVASVCSSMAQQSAASNSKLTRNSTARNAPPSSGSDERSASTQEERSNQVAALLKRKAVLQEYLRSINPKSPDYQATENAIREIDLKLAELNKESQADVSTASIAVTSSLAVPTTNSLPPATSSRAPLPQTLQAGKSLNDFLVAKIKAKIDQASNSKQTETPSVSNNSTALVDQSSASDLISMALNLSGLTFKSDSGDKQESDSMSVTASAYSVYAALEGVKPLNPVFYNQNRGWRQVFFTLGFDNEKANGTATTDRAKIIGVKVLLIDKRDPNDKRYTNDFETLRAKMREANVEFGQIYRRIIIFLFTKSEKAKELINQEFEQFLQNRKNSSPTAEDLKDINLAEARLKAGDAFKFGSNNRLVEDEKDSTKDTTDSERRYFTLFLNTYLTEKTAANPNPKGFSQDILDDLNKFIDDELGGDLGVFAQLNDQTHDLIEKIRKAPQLALSVVTKQRENGADDYTTQLIYDYGLGDRVNLTLNGNFNYVNSRVIGGDTRGGTFAGQLQFRFDKQPENISGKTPVYFYLATNNSWAVNTKPIYSGQAKLTIPLVDGLEIPLSFVVASRTNASNKNIIKGQFAFTVDTAKLLKGLLSK